MIDRLHLLGFKSFLNGAFDLGPFTVLIGANAAGKSNVRDALRVLHGVGRGYTLAEIIGEKYGEGGVPLWKGVRGGVREVTHRDASVFIVAGQFRPLGRPEPLEYGLGVELVGGVPVLGGEWLKTPSYSRSIFDTTPERRGSFVGLGGDERLMWAQVYQRVKGRDPAREYLRDRPLLGQVANDTRVEAPVRALARQLMDELAGLRFLDLSPDAMRQPSVPGQTVLSDRGENLSSVLEQICLDPQRKDALVGWVQALTPTDVTDFRFPRDLQGKTLVTLVEHDGREVSAYSASDGTLRFLGIAAALLGPDDTSRTFFLEELDNGIHPTRVSLLLDFIQQRLRQDKRLQVIATTHSPSLLRLLGPDALKHASLVYRDEATGTSHVRRILDIPEARELLKQRDVGALFESGWMENSMAFATNEEGGDGIGPAFEAQMETLP